MSNPLRAQIEQKGRGRVNSRSLLELGLLSSPLLGNQSSLSYSLWTLRLKHPTHLVPLLRPLASDEDLHHQLPWFSGLQTQTDLHHHLS